MIVFPIELGYRRYLADESCLTGTACCVVFPVNTQQLGAALRYAAERGHRATIQGSRTGLAGGAVPNGGIVVSLERMNRILNSFEKDGKQYIHVQAGVTLEEIETLAQSLGSYCPFDPTETTATVGGMFATGGKGPASLSLGCPSRYIEVLSWVTPGGGVWSIERGKYIFDSDGCTMPDGTRLSVPADTCARGIAHGFPRAGEDLIDFLSGSEGRLGVVAELVISILPRPEHRWGVAYFFSDSDMSGAFLAALRDWPRSAGGLVCAEYFDEGALRLLIEEKERSALLKSLPSFPANAIAAFYIELAGSDDLVIENALAEHLDLFAGVGGEDKNTWAESGSSGIKRLRMVRHAIPEIAGCRTSFLCGSENCARLETDFTGPPEKAAQYLQMYRDGAALSGVPCAVYGHILQNSLHATFMYESPEQYAGACAAIERWAERVIADGGLLVSENGMGRLKTELVNNLLPAELIDTLKEIKAFFDPDGYLN